MSMYLLVNFEKQFIKNLFTILVFVVAIFKTNAQAEEAHVIINTCCELNLKSVDAKSASCTPPAEDDNRVSNNAEISPDEKARLTAWEIPPHLMANNEAQTFQLANRSRLCTSGDTIHRLETETISNPPFQLKQNGWIGIGSNELNMSYFNTDQYCLYGIGETYVELRMCNPPCTKNEPCIYKCCPLNKAFSSNSEHNSKCEDIPSETTWQPKFYRDIKDPSSLIGEEENLRKAPFYIIRHPSVFETCPDKTITSYTMSKEISLENPGFQHSSFRLSEDGMIYYRNEWRNWVISPNDKLCVDGIQNYLFNEEKTSFKNGDNETIMLTCWQPLPFLLNARQVNEYYGIIAIIFSIFALMTVVVYGLLWEKQNIHGWTIMAYSTNLFFLFICLGISHLCSVYNSEFNGTIGCKILATILHFLFIGMFTWLTIISLDLWLTFRSITVSITGSNGHKRFCLYCLGGLGIPTIMIILGWILEIKYADDENSEVKVPLYGVEACYVSTFFMWEFVYGPCAILFITNLIFFVFTTWKLIEYQKSTKFATQTAQNRQSYFLFVKLFFLVGILWGFEIISWASSGIHVSIVWQIFDTLNCLQPLALFIIFVLKYDTINSLAEKYPGMKPCLKPILKLFDVWKRTKKFQTKKSTNDTTNESSGLNMTKTTSYESTSGVEDQRETTIK